MLRRHVSLPHTDEKSTSSTGAPLPSHWNTGNDDPNDKDYVCGIRLVPYEGYCSLCKMPVDDDCPLSTCLLPCTINDA